MKNKIRYAFPALVLCMSVFFMPVTAHAQSAADTTPPTISAKLSGDTLHIEASDDSSGVDAVFIGDKRVNYRVDNAVDVAFQDYAGTAGQTVGVYAVDFAGNKSDVVNIKNPYYKAPAETTPPAQTSKPSATAKPSASASSDPEETPDTKPLTPDGQATVTDDATDEDGKEFYTFTTPNDNVFYLVIDKQRDSENVYFLNAVTEDDLMALAETDEKKDNESAMPEVEVCSCKDKCEAGEVNTACPVCKNDLKGCTGKAAPVSEEPETEKPKKESNGGAMIFVLLAVAAAGGAGYYFKVYKPKHDLDDAEELDDLLGDGDEPEINEDGMDSAAPEQTEPAVTEDTAAYDDYPDDYPEDEPEREE